jgi:hypothetical protein
MKKMSVEKAEIYFLCPYCMKLVKSPLYKDGERFFVQCPDCYPKRFTRFEAKVSVNISDDYFKMVGVQRTRLLQNQYCEFDGLGYKLKKEYWELAMKYAEIQWWGDSYAFHISRLPLAMEERPPEPFWYAEYIVFGNFNDIKDTYNTELIHDIYVVESEEEARFIKRTYLFKMGSKKYE